MAEETPFIPYADRDALPDQLKTPLEAYEARMGFGPTRSNSICTGRNCWLALCSSTTPSCGMRAVILTPA